MRRLLRHPHRHPLTHPDEAPVSSPPAPAKEETPVAPASGASRVYEGLSFVVAAFVALVF
ncbi:hypothetical protein Pint_12636 [Pistacia integerrima]|uniref:Uncharacterized protein n=1 Tax=Pistacia integerrima TaxID=434235 RepID=A0ACC0Y7H1_9ROSI|nr:hypothetical protein Pint_12636 [Pistacia integerrima]